MPPTLVETTCSLRTPIKKKNGKNFANLPARSGLNDRHAISLGERGVQKNVALIQYVPNLRVLQTAQQRDSVLQMLALSNLLNEPPFGPVATDNELNLRMFRANLSDDLRHQIHAFSVN